MVVVGGGVEIRVESGLSKQVEVKSVEKVKEKQRKRLEETNPTTV